MMNIIQPYYTSLIHAILFALIIVVAIATLPFDSWQFVVFASLFALSVNIAYLTLKESSLVSQRITLLISFLIFLLLTFSPYLANFTNILEAVYAVFFSSVIGLVVILFTDLPSQT